MAADDDAVLHIEEIEVVTHHELIVVTRCIAPVRIGAQLRCIRGIIEPVDLTVVELWRYAGLQVDEIAPPHAARVILAGTGSTMIRPGHYLEGTNPVTA
jgi:hypothetical protein